MPGDETPVFDVESELGYQLRVEAMDRTIADQSVENFLKNSADIEIDEEDESDFMEAMRLASDKAET